MHLRQLQKLVEWLGSFHGGMRMEKIGNKYSVRGVLLPFRSATERPMAKIIRIYGKTYCKRRLQ